jgi:fused signal recognition particle receptor
MNDTTDTPKLSWWRRLSSGLKRTSTSLGTAVADLVTKRKLDRAMLEDIEDVLLRADLGTDVAARIAEAVGAGRYDKAISADEVKNVVATEVEKVLSPVAKPLVLDTSHSPFVILVVGVNGSGKTTTIGKLSAKFFAEGRKVMLAAGDTFRAAAIEQLKVWGERTKSPVIAGAQGSDSAGLAFTALTSAKEQKIDVLLIDTAGRLQNKAELMNELEKVVRVIRKVDATAPHAVLLVLDATVGQNALSQVEAFHRIAGVTGLVMTKLDGTARGGILVALAEKHKLPVHFIGVGEGVEDLAPFAAKDFAKAIAGLDD